MKTTKKLLLGFLFALAFVVTPLQSFISPIAVTNASSSTEVTEYHDWGFFGKSDPQFVLLQTDADFISLCATCEDETETDVVTCYIKDITHNGAYSCTFDIPADGSVTSVLSYFPQGRYKVYFKGDGTVEKSLAFIIFSAYL